MKCTTPKDAQATINAWRLNKLSIGFVPTMGALHQGHISLLTEAKNNNDKVIVSIFVNPLQFNDKNDFDNYPNTFEQDQQLLQANGCDLIIHGSFNDFFPHAKTLDDVPLLTPGKIAEALEGAHRPGHFAGVKTIVAQLFTVVGDCRAYFGEKDFQQTKVISQLAEENGFPTVVICPTVRAENGLALSSRNARLSETEKVIAGNIFATMTALKKTYLKNNHTPVSELLDLAHEMLQHDSMVIEYIAIKDDENWFNNETVLAKPRVLIALQLGNVRLIDNMQLY